MDTLPKTNSTQKNSLPQPILIFDKRGIIGKELLKRILAHFADAPIVFVSEKKETEAHKKLLFIPLSKKLPTLPNATYSFVFIISEGDRQTEILRESLIAKAKQDNAYCIFLESLSSFEEKIGEELLSSYKNLAIIVFGELFGKDVPLEPEKRTDQLIYQAKRHQRVILFDSGTNHVYPVSLDDVVEKTFQIAFGTFSHELFLLFPKHPPTELRFAHAIVQIEPDVKIDFSSVAPRFLIYEIPKNGQYLLTSRYPLKEKLEKAHAFLQATRKEILENKQNAQRLNARHVQSRQRRMLFFLGYAVVCFLILPMFLTAVFSFGGFFCLFGMKQQFGKGDLAGAETSAQAAHAFFLFAKTASDGVWIEASVIGQGNGVSSFSQLVTTSDTLSLASEQFLFGVDRLSTVLSAKSRSPKDDLSLSIAELRYSLSLFENLSVSQRESFAALGFGNDTSDLIKQVSFLANNASGLLDQAQSIVGIGGTKKYLVLLENNMELRPGGGFIGSYALVSFTNGAISDVSIHNVYDADGQLRGHIEPPFAIRRYLPSVHLFLRDSNFDPDFTKDAKLAAFMLKEETNETVDGVIGIDVSFIQALLSVTGPVYISEYNQTVNSDNFFFLAQSHAEKNFFAGSTQKQDFLRSVVSTLKNVFSTTHFSYPKLFTVIENAIQQKDLLFASGDGSVQKLLIANEFSGALLDTRQQDDNRINDFVGVSEANLGVNKANAFITRSIHHHVTVTTDGAIQDSLTISYTNTSTDWPGGDYKNYLRVILPLHSTFLSLSFDNVVQATTAAIIDPLVYEAKNFQAPKEVEITKEEEAEKTLYGFLVTIPKQSKKTITIVYQLPFKITSDQLDFLYDLKIVKQPGTNADPYAFSLTTPTSFRLLSSDKDTAAASYTAFTKPLAQDMDILYHFGKK